MSSSRNRAYLARKLFAYVRLGKWPYSSASRSMILSGRIFVESATSSISSLFARRALCSLFPTESTIPTDSFVPEIRSVQAPNTYLYCRVQVHQNFSRFCSVAGTQNAPLLQDVNYSRGSCVTGAQSTLEHRGRGPLFLTNHLQTFLNQFLVFIVHFLVRNGTSFELILDRRIKNRTTLRGNKINQLPDFVVCNQNSLRPD